MKTSLSVLSNYGIEVLVNHVKVDLVDSCGAILQKPIIFNVKIQAITRCADSMSGTQSGKSIFMRLRT